MTRTRPPLVLPALGLAALLGACYTGAAADAGDAAASEPGVDTGSGGAGEVGGSDETGAPPADDPVEVAGPTLRRLTAAEFTHSLQDLLGPVTHAAVEADSLQGGFFAVGAAKVALSPDGVARYEKAVDEALVQAFADPARLPTILACVPAQPTDTACARNAIAAFGRRAWRRPLGAVELARYEKIAADVAAETGDLLVGLRHALWGLLQSPNFLYRVELGVASPADGGRLKFTGWEMASRLAFTLWNTLPDEALLDAAARGDLDGPVGIAGETTRMLADPRARQGVANFFAELYGLWALGEKLKDDVLYPEWTPTLKAAVRQDLLARVDDVVFTAPDDFFALYDGRRVFVDNELAAVYGVPAADPDVWRLVELPPEDPRRGLIASGALLAMNSLPARTSATERGQFIAEALLCRTVPPPPPEVDTNLDGDMMSDPGPKTLREKLEPHRTDPACNGCHSITDPLGLALEHFDTIGRWRATDQGLTIDASGELDGVYFADGAELATLLRDHPDAPMCLVRKLYTYTAGRNPFGAEKATLDALESTLAADDNRFDRLLVALVTHDDFRFANPPGSVVAADEGDKP
jgi:hypothetical protein